MRVVCEQKLVQQIDEEIKACVKNGLKVAYIELTKEEIEKLNKEVGYFLPRVENGITKIFGITIKEIQ